MSRYWSPTTRLLPFVALVQLACVAFILAGPLDAFLIATAVVFTLSAVALLVVWRMPDREERARRRADDGAAR